MSAFSLNFPPGTQSQMQTALDGYMDNIGGRNCILYFPPIQQPCPNGHGENVQGGFPNNYWVTGNPQWGHSEQSICTYCGGQGFINVEPTGMVTLLVYEGLRIFRLAPFNAMFPIGERMQDGIIATRGFVKDLPNILNCTRMETYLEAGTNHYNFTLTGEPKVTGKVIQNRYFYAIWKRS